MTPRVKKLRDKSLKAVPSITGERARLITEFYKSPEAGRVSPPVQHALAFKHILEHKAVVIDDGEIVEEADHETLMAQGGLYAEMYTRQFELGQGWEIPETDDEA